MQQKGRFSNTRLTAYKHQGTGYNAVSQYPVQFLKTSGDPVFLFQTYF